MVLGRTAPHFSVDPPERHACEKPLSALVSPRRGTSAMAHQVVRGFAWYTYPDLFGVEDESTVEPGHPFSARMGEVVAPSEVVYFRPAHPADAGLGNERRAHSYLIFTRTSLHPKICNGWESEPA